MPNFNSQFLNIWTTWKGILGEKLNILNNAWEKSNINMYRAALLFI